MKIVILFQPLTSDYTFSLPHYTIGMDSNNLLKLTFINMHKEKCRVQQMTLNNTLPTSYVQIVVNSFQFSKCQFLCIMKSLVIYTSWKKQAMCISKQAGTSRCD